MEIGLSISFCTVTFIMDSLFYLSLRLCSTYRPLLFHLGPYPQELVIPHFYYNINFLIEES